MKTTPLPPLVISSLRPVCLWIALECFLAIFGPGAGRLAAQPRKPVPRSVPVTAPAWFEKVAADEKNLVARGRAEAKDQQLAIDRAVLAARADIATALEGHWKAFTGEMRKEGFSPAEPTWEPFALKKSTIKKQKAVRRGKTWTAFVLVSVPKKSVPSLLLERARSDQGWYSAVKEAKAVRRLEQPSR